MSEFLTVRQVRAAFGVSAKTVRRWIRNGLLGARKHRVTGTLFVARAEVERVLSEDLKPWAPGERPIMLKAARGAVHEEESKVDTEMTKKEQKTTTKAQSDEEIEQEEAPRRSAREERAPPRRSSGTIFDEDEEG